MQIDKVILKDMLIEFLEKLNNGEKISYDDMELNFFQIKASIDDILYSIDDFPVDNSNDQIYSFIENEKKFFDKYEIQNISDVILEYMIKSVELNKDYNFYNNIIINYINNDGITRRTIDYIVSNYAHSENCKDSKNILEILSYKSIPEKILKKEILKIEEIKDKEVLSYATNPNYIKDIADSIMEIVKLENCKKQIQKIIKDSKLPKRGDESYITIENYKPYELTHCISYEMAVRNQEIKLLLKNIILLTIANKRLFKLSMETYSNNEIQHIAKFYIKDTLKETVNKVSEYFKSINIPLDIDFNNFDLMQSLNDITKVLAEASNLLEDKYYMIHDCKEIIPKGMEDIFDEPNHYEVDIELNEHYEKVINSTFGLQSDKKYKDYFSKNDCYVTYLGAFKNSNSYGINKIFPNFKRPMREFNQTQVAFNMSLPKEEIIAYITRIKDDYDNKENSYKTLNQLLYEDDSRIEEKLDHTQQNRYADDFFIYDYYTQSDEEHEKKLESIQKRLSQYHGMKVEKGRNNYEHIDYNEALIKMNTPKTKTNSNSFADIAKSFKEHDHIIHYLETINIIEDRFKSLKNAIDNKKYKRLICHG